MKFTYPKGQTGHFSSLSHYHLLEMYPPFCLFSTLTGLAFLFGFATGSLIIIYRYKAVLGYQPQYLQQLSFSWPCQLNHTPSQLASLHHPEPIVKNSVYYSGGTHFLALRQSRVDLMTFQTIVARNNNTANPDPLNK